jgi:hypothetical protein
MRTLALAVCLGSTAAGFGQAPANSSARSLPAPLSGRLSGSPVGPPLFSEPRGAGAQMTAPHLPDGRLDISHLLQLSEAFRDRSSAKSGMAPVTGADGMALLSPPHPLPGARGEPIPTEWPHAKVEPIPTTWQNLNLMPVAR